ncbi:hypothetical protein [Colwellia sp. UCD-KL20]|uniref:hypothetical protein n=1 Tax=Colwellia sp. UCD-KL20 TaxID=1917165 RepID=UPI00097119C1|nr:hypothetical protein [Colwellia sp. UCD-KL20]
MTTTKYTTTIKRIKFGLLTLFIALGTTTAAFAGMINGTGDITPNVIFGTGGNANGSFTGETNNNIEVGLRAKQRYPAANIFNYNAIDTYTFDSTVLTTNPSTRSVFNFEWSINVNQDNSTSFKLSDFSYLFSFDTDASAGVSYTEIDPFSTIGWFDHSLGDNSTISNAGIESTNNADLTANMSLYSVAQQSANLGFGFSNDPDLPGSYNFKMAVLDLQTQEILSSAEIVVLVTPLPVPTTTTFPLLLGGLCLFFMARKTNIKK